MEITKGQRVEVTHETGIIERGTVMGLSNARPGEQVIASVRYDDGTYFSVPTFRCNPHPELWTVKA